ncbi:MAG: hypothetical protein AAGA09_04135 [Pseudomonadota bacterium]
MAGAAASGAAPGTPAPALQIPLALPLGAPSYKRADFMLSDANRAALQIADGWREIDEPALVICGPNGAGKTHLAHIAAGEEAVFLSPATFAEQTHPGWRSAPVVVVDDLPGEASPRAILDALTVRSDAGARTILVGAGDPAAWAGGFKDLETRLQAMPRAILDDPDEALIRAVMVKLFKDRQIDVKSAIIDYAAPRLQRTFGAASAFVALTDEAAMAANGRISLTVAQNIVGKLCEAGSPG